MQKSEAVNPKAVNLVAYALLSFPLSYVIALGAFYNLPIAKMVSIFFDLQYILHSAIAVFNGWSLHKMRPYAWHLFVFNCALLIAEQFYVAYTLAENNTVEIPLIFSVAIILITLFTMKAELRVPYFSPRIAWWESDPRYKISVPAQMTSLDHLYQGEIMDISANGCFIKSKAPLKADMMIHVKFALFDQHFSCEGKIVWQTESAVTHPKGVGIKFVNLDRKNQISLRETVKKLRNLSAKFKNIRKEEKAVSIEQKVQNLIAQRKDMGGS